MIVKQRMVWLDCLRLAAGVSMLGLHSTADPQGLPWVEYAAGDRVAPLLIRAILYTARTELFLIISVFLLLLALDRRPRSYPTVIKEQVRRLLVPFLFWTVFFAGFGLIKASSFGYYETTLSEIFSPAKWLSFLLLGGVKYHMHFLPTLFALVLFFPLFRIAVQHPVVGVSVVIFLVIKQELDSFIFSSFWGQDTLPYLVRGVKVLTYVGYGMVAGAAYGIWKKTSPTNRQQWFPIIAYFGAILFLFKLIAIRKTIELESWPYTYAPGYWSDFLFPVVIFAGCMSLGHLKWPDLISKLAPYSFGVYLCHPIFLDLCEILLRDSTLSPFAQVSTKIATTLIATGLLVYLISKANLLAWTIGLGPLPNLRTRTPTKEKAV